MTRPRAGGRFILEKIVIHRPGGHDRLRLERHPDPEPGPGEVLIDVRAAGVNFADCIARMGLYASAREYVGWPLTPGFEVAGTVAATGREVSGFRAGDAVLALTLFGGYATRLTVPAGQVAPVPEGWSWAQAAGFPTVFLTAWYALCRLADPEPGARVLVHSAAGGVGQALVQLARVRGCRVTAVVGAAHKRETVAALGAEAVIDRASQDLWQNAESIAPDGFDAVFDANGVATLRQSYRHLAPGGRLIVYGFHTMFRRGRSRPSWTKLAWDWLRTPRFNPLEMTGANRSVMAFNLSFMGHRADVLRAGLDQLMEWAGAGLVAPLPTTTHAFRDAAEAHRCLESGLSVGKHVLLKEE